MHEPVSKSEFKAKALELFREVEHSGEPLIVTDRGQPAVEIRRFVDRERGPLQKLRGSVAEYHDPFASVAEDEWEALS